MSRSPQSQSRHNTEVSRLAKSFKNRGFYFVRADVAGYPKPSLIGRLHRPDIEASTKNDREEWITYIVEVETKETVNTEHAKSQRAVFQNAANKDKNTHFKLCVV